MIYLTANIVNQLDELNRSCKLYNRSLNSANTSTEQLGDKIIDLIADLQIAGMLEDDIIEEVPISAPFFIEQ